MLRFRDYLILEKSLYKVDALLRADPQVGLQPGYAPITPFLGPRASETICALARHLLDQVAAKQIPLGTPRPVPVAKLEPTQHAVYVDDVKDIAHRQNFTGPIHAFTHNGHLYILNGHHRAAAAALVQRPTLSAYVIPA